MRIWEATAMNKANALTPLEAVNKIRDDNHGQVVLVLQGGGALGAYQGGVYQALHEAGVEPDWLIGTSIGAINASLIAGNKVEDRFSKLNEFWRRVDYSMPLKRSDWSRATSALGPVADIDPPTANVRYVPNSRHCQQAASEVWIAPADPLKPYQRAIESPARKKLLTATLVTRCGEPIHLNAHLPRSGSRKARRGPALNHLCQDWTKTGRPCRACPPSPWHLA